MCYPRIEACNIFLIYCNVLIIQHTIHMIKYNSILYIIYFNVGQRFIFVVGEIYFHQLAFELKPFTRAR